MSLDLESLPLGDGAPELVNAVVEVPVGSRNKFEYDPELGLIVRDRVLPGNVRYPTDYGFIPSTESYDGEPLDVMVAAYDPVFRGCVLRMRPIGALDATDEDANDTTIILAVPDDDPRFDDAKDLDDITRQNLRKMEQFYATYERLEVEGNVEVGGWLSREETLDIIRDGTRESS